MMLTSVKTQVSVLLWFFFLHNGLCHAEQLVRLPSASECQRIAEDNLSNCESQEMKRYCETACKKQSQRKRLEPFGYTKAKSFYELEATDIDGNHVDFSEFKGKVVLIVNVASYCESTKSHYKQLNSMYKKFHSKGLEILAFPCNQFGGQEPDSPQNIKEFCEKKQVKFRLMEKVEVNGQYSHDIYKFLKRKMGPDTIEWNFGTYYLVGKDGQILYFSGYAPLELEGDITLALRGEMEGEY